MIFDTHAHYDDEQFNEDRDELIGAIHEGGVGRIVDICANADSYRAVLELAHRYPFIYAAVGVHPDDVGKLDEAYFSQIERAACDDKCVAIGEIGLDYHWMVSPKEVQQEWFRRQIDLARRLKKPFVIHSRDAAADTLSVVKDEKSWEIGGVMHCFSYEVEMAREYLNMGFFLGVGGVVTYKNGRKLKEVVTYAPIEQILVETDCPYLSPTPHRGERNNSSYIKYVIEEIARLKNMESVAVEEITYQNACRFYNLSDS
ncbi:MAG: TatD family hydrolase [Lachnospiraceae bacterium]|nr:TatD family hydrolase [Lachnospiraceae bacterium]